MPQTENNRLDYLFKKVPRCPSCDFDIDIRMNELYELCEEGDHDIECPACGCAIRVSTRVTLSYSTVNNEVR